MQKRDTPFTFECEKDQDYFFFKISGVINSQNSQEVRPPLLEVAEQAHMILDLSEVAMLTSSGVGILFELVDLMQKQSLRLVIVNPSDQVRQVLELTGFTNLFTMAESKNEAQKLISK